MLIAAALALAPPPSHARVFMRTKAGAALADVMRASNARLVYESTVTLNGGNGDLAVYGVQDPIDSLVRTLRQSITGITLDYEGGTLALGQADQGAQSIRLVVAQPIPDGMTMLFALRQDAAEFRKSAAPPTASARDLPLYPGSELRFSAQDAQAGVDFAVAHTAAPAAEIRAYFNRQLATAGWQPIPTAPAGRDPALTIYARDQATMLVLISANATADDTTITVLHKRQGVK